MDAQTIATALLLPKSSAGKNDPSHDPQETTMVTVDKHH